MGNGAPGYGWTVARTMMAVLIVSAIVAQLVASIETASALDRDVAMTFANFFSFFTILSNALAAIVLFWATIWFMMRGREAEAIEPRSLAVALASVTTYMVITGIVYNALLRGIVLPQGSEPIWWSNEVLHLVGPLFLLADLFFGPRRRALGWGAVGAVIVFPLIWIAYTLVRGPLVVNPTSGDPFWYPYPFLNPNNPGGWGSVIVYIIGIAIAIIAVASFVVWVGRRRGTVDSSHSIGAPPR